MRQKSKRILFPALSAAVLLGVLAGCGAREEGKMQMESLSAADLLSGEEESGRDLAGEPASGGKDGETAGQGKTPEGDNTDGSPTEGALSGNGSTGASGSPDGLKGQDTGSLEESPRPVPRIVENPFVDKLTEEGIGWGLGFGDPGTQPVGNVSSEELVQYSGYFCGDGQEQVIYLTFDCGYENGNTEPILDALEKHDAPATFFVVGHYLETQPELVKRMTEEGHAVGNHTYHHHDINTLDGETFRKELGDVASLFQEITGQELSPYYRPPEGKCGSTNMRLAQEEGYFTCFWSLAYVDWDADNQPTHQEALDKLTSRIHPGAIVLLHNTSATNGEILDELLTKWEEMGYTFAPLSELVQGKP